MRKYLQNPWLRLIIAVATVGVLYGIVRASHIDFSNVTIESFKAKVNSWGVWGPIAYIVLYILRPLVLFPAGLFSAAGGAIWGLQGFTYIMIGVNISSLIEFAIARYGAREAVEKLLKGRMQGLDAAIEKRGFVTVLLIRVIPNVAWDIQNLGLGLTKVKFRDYFWATLIGSIPGTFAYVYFGASIITIMANPHNFIVISLALALLVGIYFLRHFLKQKHGNLTKP